MKKVIVIGLFLMVLLSGCVEKQPVWGKGELEPSYVRYFGTDNTARLNKAQNDLLNKHNAVLHGIDQTTDGKTAHTNGIIDLLFALEGRVKALEAVDPNDYHYQHEHITATKYTDVHLPTYPVVDTELFIEKAIKAMEGEYGIGTPIVETDEITGTTKKMDRLLFTMSDREDIIKKVNELIDRINDGRN